MSTLPSINLIFFSLIFMISCSSQNESALSENTRTKLETAPNVDLLTNPLNPPKPKTQIAEYIRHIFQDKNGNFWYGTNGYGTAHYNGDSISYFSLDQGFGGTQILGISEDPEKNIWFATDQGAVKYDWSNTENGDKLFTNYPSEKFLDGERPWSILADSKGIIWVGTNRGVFRFKDSKWKAFEMPYSEGFDYQRFSNRTTWSISEDKKGNIWFGTNGNGAFKYDPSAEGSKSFIQYTKKDGLTDNSVDVILEDKNGDIWFGTRFGGASHYDGQTFTNYTQRDGLSISNDEVCAIYEDKRGNIWMSSEGFGVYRFDGKSFTNFGENEGLGVRAVQTIFEDREGRFWVGGGGGLYRFNAIQLPSGKAGFYNVTKDGPWD